MSIVKKVLGGCVVLPILLVASCAGKMYVDDKMYNLPGEILKSPAKATQNLATAGQVAEALDSYVQPRFEILRNKDFGAIRITYRKHAGVVQLKVDTPQEKQIIANVNAANRDYAICLLHCVSKPPLDYWPTNPNLDLLYFNQQQVITNSDYYPPDTIATKQLDFETIEKQAISVIPALMAKSEQRVLTRDWEVLMRPVPARRACLSCHAGAKNGDTLGVMVYAVRKTKRGEGKSIGMR